jgi:hypothetical protein
MQCNSKQRRSRAPAGLVAVVAALGLSMAPAVIAPASAGALPIQGLKKCTPGDIKTSGGKKYVCDKYGHWIHVVSAAALNGTVAGIALTTVGPASGISLTSAARHPAHAVRKEANDGGGPVTCGMGSKPGDYREDRTYTYRNGQRIGFTSVTYVCGKDGEWHQVADALAHTLTVASGTVIATAQGLRP